MKTTTKLTLLTFFAVALVGCGSPTDTVAYNSEISKSVPVPRSDGPTFAETASLTMAGKTAAYGQ